MLDEHDKQALAFVHAALGQGIREAEAALALNPALGDTSLHVAAIRGDEETVRTLLHAAPSTVDMGLVPDWRPLLLLAHSHYARPDSPGTTGVLACAELLLASGASVARGFVDNDVPGGIATPLCGAAGTGNAALCELLLARGAPADDGASLFLALAAGNQECVRLLRDAGAPLGPSAAAGGHTPLHWMLDVRCVPAAIQRLLAEGANPNERVGERRETALHVAVRRRRVEWIEPLLAAGAEPEAETAGGLTAWRHAFRRGFDDAARKLEESGAVATPTASDELADALQRGDLSLGQERLARAAVSDWNAEECRLLPDLAAGGKADALEVLLDAGVDITARGLDGGTALHQAAWFGQTEIARRLLARSAPLDVRGDTHDSTPIGWAAHGSRWSGGADERQEAYVDITQQLLDAGARLPGPEDSHDHPQLAQASDAVRALLLRRGREPAAPA